MEKERKVKKLALVAVIVAVLGMTIAFAALSQTLTINGTANMEEAIWEISFTGISEPIKIGSAKTDYPYDTATGGAKRNARKTAIVSEDLTEISDIRAILKKPGDEVRYTTDLENYGTIDAEIASIEMPSLTDAQKEIFDFSVIYTKDGKEVSVGDVLPKCSVFEDGGCVDETNNVQPITIKIRYKDITDASLLPEEAQSITLSYKINFVQSDSSTLYHAGNQIFGIELSNGQTMLTGAATATNLTLVGTTIEGYTVTLANIGDKAVYKFDITNIADHAVTVSSDISLYKDEFNACNNKKTTEHPECAKFDFNGDIFINGMDLALFNDLRLKIQGIDGSNKIPANSTKTFTITTEMPSDFDGNLTGEAITVLSGDINVSAK